MINVIDEKSAKLFELFESLGIPYQNHFHEPAFTVDQARHLYDEIPGGHCKSLFLKNKKNEYLMVIIHCNDKLDIKAFSKLLGKGSLSFASHDRLKEILSLKPGSVTPFAVINDVLNSVQVVLDQKLLNFKLLNYHPLRNDITTTISSKDLLKFLSYTNHEAKVLHVPLQN